MRSFLHRWGVSGGATRKLRRRATATLRAAGGQPCFTTYPGVGHGARPGLLDRLLAQRPPAALGHPKRP